MSYLIATPQEIAVVATETARISAAINTARATAAASTTQIAAAAQDEVSAAVATVFGTYAQDYQALSAPATNFHDRSSMP